MSSDFLQRWREQVRQKESVLCAGLDPAEHALGRGERGLSQGTPKRKWCIQYVTKVAPYCAAIKFNIQYWKGKGDLVILDEICALADSLGLMVIDDSKLADIGATNQAGMFYAEKRANAVTMAPFAGNYREAVECARDLDIALIGMGIMSNPDYHTEKRKLVPVDDFDAYRKQDVISCGDSSYVPQYVFLARTLVRAAFDGIVVAAPSEDNHITLEELSTIREYIGDNMAVLSPGIGAQKGSGTPLWEVFDSDQVIVNVGRALMFPDGSDSTPEQQAQAAQSYRQMLNDERSGA